MTRTVYRNFEKSFLECEKNGFKKHLPALFPPREFSHVCIINKYGNPVADPDLELRGMGGGMT